MKYLTHSKNGRGIISIKPIENGFIVSYDNLLDIKEIFIEDLENLQIWLKEFYREED